MVWFMGILMMMISGTSHALLLLDETEIDTGQIYSMLIQSYRLAMLGDFDFEYFTSKPYLTIIWIMTTFIVVFVLLNMLIAIMGDTYDRVQEQITVLFYKAKAGLLLDYWDLPWCGIKGACQRTYAEQHFLHLSIPAEW